jgi:two-component system alkaline phosphatase synthesis response regulator PhoP
MTNQKSKILIIEDEKILAEMYRDKFEEEGYEIRLAFSSEEAFDYLKREKPDLILLDILLPGESGIGFLKKFKEIKRLSKIPVVAFSNYDEPKTKKEALELGAKAYLIKTQYTPKGLLEEVKKFFKAKRKT